MFKRVPLSTRLALAAFLACVLSFGGLILLTDLMTRQLAVGQAGKQLSHEMSAIAVSLSDNFANSRQIATQRLKLFRHLLPAGLRLGPPAAGGPLAGVPTLWAGQQNLNGNIQLLEQLRDNGVHTGGPAALSQADRQAFANALDRLLRLSPT